MTPRPFLATIIILGTFCIWSAVSFVHTTTNTVSSQRFATGTSHPTSKNSIHDTTTSRNSMTSLQGQKVGFIGCGTIAAAIATGLATTDDGADGPLVSSISISRRSKAKSAALAERFPELVTVHDDNQEILDRSDIIFITVLPEQASTVLQSLKFDPERHNLVSLVVSS
jgi:shikimate 5-dehydrogenase